MSGRHRGLFVLLNVGLMGGITLTGCGGDRDNHVPQILTVEVNWNDSPSAVDQIGYQLGVDLVWPDRRQGCYSLSPNLAIRIDDDIVVAPPIEGDCAYESLVFVNGVAPQESTTVSLRDGDQTLAEATFADLFPDSGATLVTPAAGQTVKAGDPFAVALPTPPSLDTAGARFYWADLPSGVPPFYSWVSGTVSADGSTFQGMAPTTTTGPAIVVIEGIFGQGDYVAATSCTGFLTCLGLPSVDEAGPIPLEVDP